VLFGYGGVFNRRGFCCNGKAGNGAFREVVSHYNVSDKSSSKKFETVPCCLRLTSKRSLKWGLELIAMLAEKEQLIANPKYKAINYLPEAKTDEEMLALGMIKEVK
jgi:hypothetical protein